jgi:lysine N6-hydroxylase
MTNTPRPPAGIPSYFALGVGAGPSNLSLAALFHHAASERIALFESQPGPAWHNTLIHPGVRMQTSWLKDLVSLVEPRHELTFLNYLVTEGRLFALLNAQFDVIPRVEYVRYLRWAAERLPDIHYDAPVDKISFGDGGFTVHSAGRPLAHGEHLVLALGTRPFIPPELSGLPGERAFIADELTDRLDAMRAGLDAPVAVIGGRQTGFEAVMRLLEEGFTAITWYGRCLWFDSIDDSPNANDIYRPAHLEALLRMSPAARRRVTTGINHTGDGLTPGALRWLYQANYDRMLQLGRFAITLRPGRDVVSSAVDGEDIVLACQTPEKIEYHRTRHVVIATGRENTPIPFDDDLRRRVETGEDGEVVVEDDFSLRWKGMNGHQIYALNRARATHGLTDANVTLLPVRAAIVMNSMFDREVYQVRDYVSPVDWG